MNALGKTILKDVSRSFYISMRVLPKAMREPVSLAYLLARASDTLADTGDLNPALRLSLLEGFGEIIHGGKSDDWFKLLETEVIPKQQHAGEKVLLKNMQGIFAWLEALGDQRSPGQPSRGALQKNAILTVMDHILQGQRLDIERFELQQGFQFTLDTELEEYCYLVAGCVGEFWTDIGIISLGNFSCIEPSRLKDLGANYGKALQLINILRDMPLDIKAGRRYLPGVDPADISSLMAESTRWRQRAREYLRDGKTYAESLRQLRTRAGTALPGLIGERTLNLMDGVDWQTLSSGVKIPRREVYHCVWEAMITRSYSQMH